MESTMSQDLTAKERNTAYQHWCSLIARESHDPAALERMSARALHDRDVCADGLLRSMVQAELERYQAELQREAQQGRQSRAPAAPLAKHYPSAARRTDFDLPRFPSNDSWSEGAPPATPATPPPPDPDQVAFYQLAEDLSEALKGGDEGAARTVCAQMRALHQRRSEIVSTAELERYEQRVTKLHAQLDDHGGQIAALAQQARAAARAGDAPAAVKLMHRLTAIHVAHPRLLDEAGLARMRNDVAHANEGHEDGVITRKLIERERAVAAEMKRLASAVSEFHRAVFSHPESRAAFRRAARVYLGVLREIHLHEKDWLAEFVLELGDVLANWSVPPPGAEQQIDRFLEKVRAALQRIHVEMGEIDVNRGGSRGP
jgi:hypothetical protein